MQSHHLAAARPSRRTIAALVAGALAAVILAACGTTTPTTSPSTSASSGTQSPGQTSQPTATPLPTPLPTPSYTNPADPELVALIPTRLKGVDIQVPPRDQFAFTPGDFGEVYGELGLRFSALQVAYVIDPRLSLYVARVDGEQPTTRSLAPYLATAAEYVGIAGLHRGPWRYKRVGNRVSWVRPEDNATVAGTHLYTWAADGYVFLMIGVDDAFNRALFAALPGERAPAATPSPSPSPSTSSSVEPSSSP